jgi:hypothetical protein
MPDLNSSRQLTILGRHLTRKPNPKANLPERFPEFLSALGQPEQSGPVRGKGRGSSSSSSSAAGTSSSSSTSGWAAAARHQTLLELCRLAPHHAAATRRLLLGRRALPSLVVQLSLDVCADLVPFLSSLLPNKMIWSWVAAEIRAGWVRHAYVTHTSRSLSVFFLLQINQSTEGYSHAHCSTS